MYCSLLSECLSWNWTDNIILCFRSMMQERSSGRRCMLIGLQSQQGCQPHLSATQTSILLRESVQGEINMPHLSIANSVGWRQHPHSNREGILGRRSADCRRERHSLLNLLAVHWRLGRAVKGLHATRRCIGHTHRCAAGGSHTVSLVPWFPIP